MPRDLVIPEGQCGWKLVSRPRATPGEISEHVGPVVACLCSEDHHGPLWIRMAESLSCAPETVTILLMGNTTTGSRKQVRKTKHRPQREKNQ